MWPLVHFESDNPCIPEIDNPPTWDGILLYLISLALIAILHVYLNKKRGRPYKVTITSWLIFGFMLCVLFKVYTGNATFLILLSSPAIFILFPILIYSIIKSEFSSKFKLKTTLLTVVIFLIFSLSVVNYWGSFAYWLPASYSKEEQDQLRMIRRIVEIQPHAGDMNNKLVPLTEASLILEEKEMISDSIRERGEYQGYRYQMKPNYPKEKLFVIDAVPIHYKPGMPSFHCFPVNPEEMDIEESPYIIYCITMADKRGSPSTEKDRHFHKKSLWYTIMGK